MTAKDRRASIVLSVSPADSDTKAVDGGEEPNE